MSNPDSTSRFSVLSWPGRHVRLLSVLSLLLLTYTLLGFLLVPHLINKYATEYVRDAMHRQLTLGQVQFNPFTLSVQITQTQFSEANGEPIGRFDYLLVNAELSSLFTGSYNFRKIQLNGPSVQIIVNPQGQLNLAFDDLNTSETPAASHAPLPAMRIDELQLSNGRIHVEDQSRPTPFNTYLAPIQFTLENFRTEPAYGNAFHFAGRSNTNETFDWQGDFTVQPLGSKGKLSIGNLQGSTIQNYLQDALPFRLLAGALTLQGEYQLTTDDALDLQLNLPSIAITAAQVAPKTGGDTARVSLSTMQLSNTQVALQKRSVQVEQLRIDGLQANAILDAKRNLNLLELLGPDEPSDTPWITTVKNITLINATVQVEDGGVTPAAHFEIFPRQLQVQNFSTAPDTIINLNSKLLINDRADLDFSGTVNLDTLAAQLHVLINSFALPDAQAYISDSTDMLVKSGQLNAEGDVVYKGNAQNKNPELKLTGNVEVTNLSTQDKAERKDFIKWQSLQLKNLSYTMAPDALEIEQVIARKPYGRVIINSDSTTNIQQVLRMQPAAENDDNKASTPQPATAAAMRTRIARVVINDGSANFTDNSVQPAFATGIQRLGGTVTGLSSANNSRATVKLDGSVDNYAPVSITGEANFIAADTYSDIAMNFKNMELTTFNPYSGKFAGYSIAKGKLATEIRYQIRDRKLDATHHIVIDQLEFGTATDSKDAVPLPIKLAVSLLKDRNGVIDLELPVNGSIDDPKFKVGPIIWKAFVNLLTKIVTAPFSALGSLFGGGEELAYVDFAPGSAMLSTTESDKLGNLSKALVERPQLKLNIPLTVINDADAAAMNQAMFEQALAAVLPNAASATATQRLAALITLHQSKLGNAPVLPIVSDASIDATASNIAYLESIIKPQFAISATDRDVLTRQRADTVQAALLTNTELSAERIFLTANSNEASSPAGVVRMALQLE